MSVVTLPILPSPDFDETSRFYGTLGFAEVGRWPGEYLILRMPEGIELHFWLKRGADPATNDVACYIRFSEAAGAQALHDRWAALALQGARLHPPRRTDYGMLEFALVDPHGNLLRIGG